MIEEQKWVVIVKGEKHTNDWEISVVREDNKFGQLSWGWFDDTKLMIGTGGICKIPVIGFVWDELIKTANELCDNLNKGKIKI